MEKTFKSFENSFYSHFGLRSNVETITSVDELLSFNSKHIILFEIDNIKNEIFDKTLSQFDFLKKNELLTFEDELNVPLTECFKELKIKKENPKYNQFFDFSITLSNTHKEFNELLKKLKEISGLKYNTFSVVKVIIPESQESTETFRYMNDSLIPLKEDIKDTLTFYILQSENNSKLLYSESPKSFSRSYVSPEINSALHYSLYRYDTGKIGWFVLIALVTLIVLFILFKIY